MILYFLNQECLSMGKHLLLSFGPKVLLQMIRRGEVEAFLNAFRKLSCDANIRTFFENRINVGCIFYSFYAVWVHSNLYPRISSSSSRAKIQRIIETGLVQISPNRWSNWSKLLNLLNTKTQRYKDRY